MIKYGSVCSGIEAASVAWKDLGWKASWVSEIEKFPSEVLKYHYPIVPNLGDMTQIKDDLFCGFEEAPDVLVGGTPCQAFSVAGLRNSLDDSRGQLSLEFVKLLNTIDQVRGEGNESICVWENVPGVLSTKDNAFGCFLGALAGETVALEPPRTGKWAHAGCVFGPQRTIAWRVFDAQYFGLAQRRKRVFVVASARRNFNPFEVLFESESVQRDTPPSRKAKQKVTKVIGNCSKTGSHWDGLEVHPSLCQCHNTGGIGASNQEIFSQRGGGLVQGHRMVAFGEYNSDDTASMIKARDYKDATDLVTTQYGDYAGTLLARHDSSPCADRGQNVVAIGVGGEDVGYSLRANPSHSGDKGSGGMNCTTVVGWSEELTASEDLAGTLHRGGEGGRHDGVMTLDMSVRRLTPTECERLMGFPDGYTRIPWRGKELENCPDGPRYKALGNSMAVPCMQWIGSRINSQIRG